MMKKNFIVELNFSTHYEKLKANHSDLSINYICISY